MVSVIIATYNGEKYIIEQLNSIMNQTRIPDEVIISDDCSVDKTFQLIQKFIKKNRLINWNLILNKKNKGYQKNFLDMLLMANGDIVFFADQDDIWNEKKIELMEREMIENEQIWSLSCGYEYIDFLGNTISSNRIKCRNSGNTYIVSFENFLNWWSYPGMSMAVKRDIIKYLPLLDNPDLIAHDWGINIISTYYNHFYFLDYALVEYRQHDNNAVGGIVNNSHDFTSERIITISTIIRHYEQALDILRCANSKDTACSNKLRFLIKKNSVYKKRLQYLTNRSLWRCLGLFRYIKFYPRARAYFGDMLTCFRLTKIAKENSTTII